MKLCCEKCVDTNIFIIHMCYIKWAIYLFNTYVIVYKNWLSTKLYYKLWVKLLNCFRFYKTININYFYILTKVKLIIMAALIIYHFWIKMLIIIIFF